MDWQRDPKTGEWVVIDPMTQSTSGAEPDPALRDPSPPPSDYGGGPTGTEAGYDPGDDGVYPVMSSQMAPERTPEGLPIYHGSEMRPAGQAPVYQNYDYEAIDRWVQEVQARGNEVRKTAVGCFEVDAGGRIVSEMPSPYRVN